MHMFVSQRVAVDESGRTQWEQWRTYNMAVEFFFEFRKMVMDEFRK